MTLVPNATAQIRRLGSVIRPLSPALSRRCPAREVAGSLRRNRVRRPSLDPPPNLSPELAVIGALSRNGATIQRHIDARDFERQSLALKKTLNDLAIESLAMIEPMHRVIGSRPHDVHTAGGDIGSGRYRSIWHM